MPIDLDVAKASAHFGIDPKLIQAVVQAEGDILKAVRCSVPTTKDRADAIDITCRSAVHAMSDFLKAGGGTSAQFVAFWAMRGAPDGADNDPTHLNANWPKNVSKLWLGK